MLTRVNNIFDGNANSGVSPEDCACASVMQQFPNDVTKLIIGFLSPIDLQAFSLTSKKILALKTDIVLVDLFNEFVGSCECDENSLMIACEYFDACRKLQSGTPQKIELLRNSFLPLCANYNHFNLKKKVFDPFPTFYFDRPLMMLLFKCTDTNTQTPTTLSGGTSKIDNEVDLGDEKYAKAYLSALNENEIAPGSLLIGGTMEMKFAEKLAEAIANNKSLKKISFVLGNFTDSKFIKTILPAIDKNLFVQEIEILGSPTTFYDAVCEIPEDKKIAFAKDKFAPLIESKLLDISKVYYDVILLHICIDQMFVNAWHPKAVIHLSKI